MAKRFGWALHQISSPNIISNVRMELINCYTKAPIRNNMKIWVENLNTFDFDILFYTFVLFLLDLDVALNLLAVVVLLIQQHYRFHECLGPSYFHLQNLYR